jgi:hypothetical protein
MQAEIDKQAATNGIIRISALKPGTMLLVETSKQIYEFTILKDDPNVHMVTAYSGEVLRTHGNLVGCMALNNTFYPNVLMFNHRAVIHLQGVGRRYTEQILSIKLSGSDWNYSLWDDLTLPSTAPNHIQGL